MKRMLLFLSLVGATCSVAAQDGLMKSILVLTGATDPAELDESVIEMYEARSARPLRINDCSRGQLVASGLFTPFQAASLEDYRLRYGDILSVMELSLVDGFASGMAEALAPFLSFEPAFANDSLPPKRTVLARGTVVGKETETGIGEEIQFSESMGIKYRHSGSRTDFGFALRGSLPEAPLSGSFFWARSDRAGRLIIGDFHARFGEGLCLWSGFDLRHPTSLDALSKRSGGFSPCHSWTGSRDFRGIAAISEMGRFGLSVALTGERLMAHLSWLGRAGQVGATAVLPFQALDSHLMADGTRSSGASAPRFSLDAKGGFRSLQAFGEAAWGGPGRKPAGIAGIRFPFGERVRAGLRLKAVPTGFSGKKTGDYSGIGGLSFRSRNRLVPAGASAYKSSVPCHSASILAAFSLLPQPLEDPGRKELRINALWNWRINPSWQSDIRIVTCLKNDSSVQRIDIRADLGREGPILAMKGRLNVMIGDGTGLLGYLEAGWKKALWIRTTVYRAESWNDRIYCYERDCPGSFSVPAYAGRGIALSLYGTLTRRIGRGRLKLCGRLYGRKDMEKPGQAGLKLQCQWDF